MTPTIESLGELMDKIIEKAKDLSGKSDLSLIDDLMGLEAARDRSVMDVADNGEDANEEYDCPIHGKLGGIGECPRC